MSNKPQLSYQELIKQEYTKCLESPVYFMKYYAKIQHPVRGTILFNLYKFQEETLQEFHDYKFNIILKSRQMGISTLVAVYSLWLMIFHKDKNILLISLKQDDAKEVIGKVRFANENLPTWLKVKCLEDNRLSLKFANGSQIKAASTTKKSGVGHALSLLIIDEAGLIDEADELWTSAQPTLSTGGSSIVLSCVTKDTMVITSKGIKEIGSFVDKSKIGGYEIDKYNVMGVDGIRCGNLFHNNGKQKTNILKTKFSSIECTDNHKVWAYKQSTKRYDWYESSQLEVGDFLSLQYGQKMWGNNDDISSFTPSISPKIHSPYHPKNISIEMAYLLGLYIAEGSVYKVVDKNDNFVGGILTITCGDNISWVFDKLNLTYSCLDGLHYTISNKNFIELMEYLGFDVSVKANQKYIPPRLMEMSGDNIKWLLRGIFDGDGCSTKKAVKLTSTSCKLIKQVRMLLHNFGILGSIVSETKDSLNSRNGKIKHNHDSHNLEICGRYMIDFFNRVGFGLERKQTLRPPIVKMNVGRACSKDVIPDSLELVKEIVQATGMTYTEINKRCNIQVNGYCSPTKYKSNNISRQNVITLYAMFYGLLSAETQIYWNNIIKSDVVWCEITSIEHSENETFDFSLPENSDDFWCHSIIYNGIIGHQTPRGVGNWFHRMWQSAEEDNGKKVGKNGFHPIKLPWNLHPERTEEWRRVEGEKIGSSKKAAQEFDCDFLASGDNVVELSIVEFYKKNIQKDPTDIRGADRGLWVWQYPDYTQTYLLSADTARGDGSDFSAAHVINATTLEQCAEYKGQLGTKDFGNLLVALGTEYNNALLIPERENVGWATIQAIIDRNYPNLFYMTKDLKYVDPDTQFSNNYYSEDKKAVPGFTTNIKTRPIIISQLELYFREKAIRIYSKRTIAELETFIWENGKAQAMKGYNDDLILSLGIGLWVRDTALRLRQEGIDITKASLNHLSMNKMDQTPFYKTQTAQRGREQWTMKTGRQGIGQHNTEDLNWLIR
jgi:intein/homing endonuclease